MIGKKFRGYCHEFGSFVYGHLLKHDYYNTKGDFLYTVYCIEGIGKIMAIIFQILTLKLWLKWLVMTKMV